MSVPGKSAFGPIHCRREIIHVALWLQRHIVVHSRLLSRPVAYYLVLGQMIILDSMPDNGLRYRNRPNPIAVIVQSLWGLSTSIPDRYQALVTGLGQESPPVSEGSG